MNQLKFFKKFKLRFYLLAIILVVFLITFPWQQFHQVKESQIATVAKEVVKTTVVPEPVQPIPLYIKLNNKKVVLGDKLFHDPQLSHNNTISCASCHSLKTGGVDRSPFSFGINGAVGFFNAPTVYNSGFNFKQNWDGRSDTLEAQIDSTVPNPISMGATWPEIVKKLKKSPEYVKVFNDLYSNGITGDNIKDAIATFERSLYTPNSRFDKFLRGDKNAITEEEKEGYRIFKDYGCVSCHQGVNLGGNLFQKFGIISDPFAGRDVKKADLGRYNITGNEEDRYVFKVPSLRNLTLTPPYFHDGSIKTIEEAIAVMAQYQLGRQLSPKQLDLMSKFLRTLNGEYQGNPL